MCIGACCCPLHVGEVWFCHPSVHCHPPWSGNAAMLGVSEGDRGLICVYKEGILRQ